MDCPHCHGNDIEVYFQGNNKTVFLCRNCHLIFRGNIGDDHANNN